MKYKKTTIWILSILVALLAIVATYLVLRDNSLKNINSYQDCVDAGYPVQESYPSRCVTPDGKAFTNPDQKLDPLQDSNL